MAIVMFAVSLTKYEIFANYEKCQNFELENECQGVEERDLRHSTGNVQIHIGDFFRILATWEPTFMQKVTHTHNEKHGWWLQICLKTKQNNLYALHWTVLTFRRKFVFFALGRLAAQAASADKTFRPQLLRVQCTDLVMLAAAALALNEPGGLQMTQNAFKSFRRSDTKLLTSWDITERSSVTMQKSYLQLLLELAVLFSDKLRLSYSTVNFKKHN